MNSKVNFHGQEIDLDKLVHARCITIADGTSATKHHPVFRVRVTTSFGIAEYSFFTEGGCQSWEMAKELDRLSEVYHASKISKEEISKQQQLADELLKEWRQKREEYSAAIKELVTMQRESEFSHDHR